MGILPSTILYMPYTETEEMTGTILRIKCGIYSENEALNFIRIPSPYLQTHHMPVQKHRRRL